MDIQFHDFVCDVWFQNLPGIHFPRKIILNAKVTLKCKYHIVDNIKDSCMKPDIYVTPGFVTILGLVFLCTINVFFYLIGVHYILWNTRIWVLFKSGLGSTERPLDIYYPDTTQNLPLYSLLSLF
jgi:hypothetical protein